MDGYLSEDSFRVTLRVRDAVDVVKSQTWSTVPKAILTKVDVNSSFRSHRINLQKGHAAIESDILITKTLLDGSYYLTKETDVVEVFFLLAAKFTVENRR